LAKDANGYWSGFVSEAAEGDSYHFWVTDAGSKWLQARSICARTGTERRHDGGFVTADHINMIISQIHIGTYAVRTPGTASTFLDIVGKIPYLVDLGINVL
jgi:1,4-alpha-glucan branching enzyme